MEMAIIRFGFMYIIIIMSSIKSNLRIRTGILGYMDCKILKGNQRQRIVKRIP